MNKIGFIGAGNMGLPMIIGAARVFGTEPILFTNKREERKEYVHQKTGVAYTEDNKSLAEACKYIVLAVKPQFFGDVYKDIKESLNSDHIIISIAAGITIDSIKQALGESIRVVRAMPNTPALVGEGMSALCFSKDEYSTVEKELINLFFQSFGKFEIFDENLMNSVVCASGSSPAYVYMFIEALADSAVKYGIPRDKAYKLTAQAVLGAAKMVLETGEHPGKLKDQVCSPGGTTIAAVEALEEYGFRNAVMKATDACYEKSVSLNK
ncbi:pyrroline-5-carboxylate reductase [Anaerocolumna xylanovorans]|uniref:Pyrroline-5-carboxylate reductase n=1 Tax=Anaerocolumna xylanovorans DSM 12503 TaxID=1121345 RepID=A0A1M7YBN7_9FIRM|nr:pyrroline-5-carboxylate reductase [Anaerocolumna xylanovorans]SHO50033.1 pyrroline-5-carboxylate reductase [Anaerocolumna xylanovorans DSM 12503]